MGTWPKFLLDAQVSPLEDQLNHLEEDQVQQIIDVIVHHVLW